MVEDGINNGGENSVVREEAAVSRSRGTLWALISIGAFVLIAALVFFGYFLKSATDGKTSESPAQMEQKRQ